jgi:hypothetical protein
MANLGKEFGLSELTYGSYGSLPAVTFRPLWRAGSVSSCPGNGRFRDGREGGC